MCGIRIEYILSLYLTIAARKPILLPPLNAREG